MTVRTREPADADVADEDDYVFLVVGQNGILYAYPGMAVYAHKRAKSVGAVLIKVPIIADYRQ